MVSVVAAKSGAHVILTDSKKHECTFKTALENLQLNSISNQNFEIQELTWGYFSSNLVEGGPINIILGSDVFYCPKGIQLYLLFLNYILNIKNYERPT